MSSSNLSHVSNAVFNQPWLVTEGMLDIIAGVIESELAGVPRAAVNKRPVQKAETVDGVDIIPVIGVISPRLSMLDEISGGVSCEAIANQFDSAISNEESNAVLFIFDSPGGNAKGVFELADKIANARNNSTKPVLAHIEGTCASAAYLLASQCDEISATCGSELGSIGAYAKFVSRDRQMKNDGVESTVIRSDPMKGIGEDHLTGEQMRFLQDRINAIGAMFKSYVARNRPQAKLSEIGAKMFSAAKADGVEMPNAVEVGLCDKVCTREDILAAYGQKK